MTLEDDLAALRGALIQRKFLDPDAPDAIAVAVDASITMKLTRAELELLIRAVDEDLARLKPTRPSPAYREVKALVHRLHQALQSIEGVSR